MADTFREPLIVNRPTKRVYQPDYGDPGRFGNLQEQYTKLYFPSSGTAAVSPEFSGGWGDTTTAAPVRRPMPTSPSSTAMATQSLTDASEDFQSFLFYQGVSAPLNGPQLLSATDVDFVIRASEDSALNNMTLELRVRAWDSQGTTFRGNLVGNTDPVEFSAVALTSRYLLTTWESVSAIQCEHGDRIVVEIGVRGNPDVGGTHNSSLVFGDDSASDLTYDDVTTAADNPHIRFHQPLLFMAEAALMGQGWM